MKISWHCAAWIVLASLAQGPVAFAHWPGQPQHQMAQLGDLKLESGQVIKNFRMSYVTHGKLNAAKDNAILFQHGFAANHHLFDQMIGPGRPLDTDKYFIICPDALGATQTGYEHTTSPTNSGLKMKFPFYSGRDMVNAQYRLITETLGIPHLLAVTGISSGADHSIQFAVSYPQFMDGVFPVVGGALWGTQGQYFVPLMASVIESCKGWEGGNYDQNPKQCATNAISVLATYFYSREWWNQYLDTPEAYTQWRNTFGDYYLDVQDARDLFYRIVAWGRSWVGDTPGFNGDLNKVLGSIKAQTLFIYSPQDEFYLPRHIDAQVKMIPNARALATDRPWSQYYCCVVIAHRDFVARNPIATKRVLRSILKASDICAADPERVARFLVDMRYETRYPVGLEVMKNTSYTRWRHDNPEDTIRFHALRLHEVGMIKSSPQKIIAQGTDWRFLNELKKELKA